MIEKRLPLEAWRRWAHKKFDLDSEFVEAVRRCTKAEESFKEQLGLEKTHENTREKGWERGERNKNLTFKENKPKPAWNKTQNNYTPGKKDDIQRKRTRQQKGITKERWNIPIGMRPTKILNQKFDSSEAEQVNAQDAA